jgi:hypothetical protein
MLAKTGEENPKEYILLRPRSNPASMITFRRRRSRGGWRWSCRRRSIKLRLPHKRERLRERTRRTASSPLLLTRPRGSSRRLRRRPEERRRRLRPRILQHLRVRRDVQHRLVPIPALLRLLLPCSHSNELPQAPIALTKQVVSRSCSIASSPLPSKQGHNHNTPPHSYFR